MVSISTFPCYAACSATVRHPKVSKEDSIAVATRQHIGRLNSSVNYAVFVSRGKRVAQNVERNKTFKGSIADKEYARD
jgi:hypothetical protein